MALVEEAGEARDRLTSVFSIAAGSAWPSDMPQTSCWSSGAPIASVMMRWNCVNAACGQVSRPRPRAATITLCRNMPKSSQLPWRMTRSIVYIKPTGAPKNW